METLTHDIRLALRSLRGSPGFVVSALLTLALGIGATTAIFSVVHGVLLRSLPYRESERLVTLDNGQSWMDLRDILAWSHSYQSGGGYASQPLDLVGSGDPVRVHAALVTGDFFSTLGVTPARGRLLTANDDQPGGARVAVLTDGFWRTRLGADPHVLGRSLTLSGESYIVVGVMPPGFALPMRDADLFAPVTVVVPGAAQFRGIHFLTTCLRLAPGVTIESARRELAAVGHRLAEADPEENRERMWSLTPLLDRVVGGVRTALWILFGAVLLALLVACTNFANLLLARSTSRTHELAVRSSMGAGQGRLVRQLLTESVVLAIAGGALGVLLATWGVRALLALRPDELPRLAEIGVNTPVLLFAAGLSLLTGLVFGLLPALHGSRLALAQTLRQAGPNSTPTAGTHRLLGSLVVSQIALALVLLIGAGLLLNAFWRLRAVEPGFDPRGVLSFHLELPETGYPHVAEQSRFRARALESLRQIPGAQVAMVSEIPLGGNYLGHNFVIEGRPPVAPGAEPELLNRNIEGRYFGIMRIPLRRGRSFTPADRAGAACVGVINEAMARRYFPGQNPLGQRIRWAREEGPPRWIVGVAADVRTFGLDAPESPAVYSPYAQGVQDWKRWMDVVVKSPMPAAELSRRVRAAVWEVDPRLPLTELRPMDDVVAASVAERRFQLVLLGLFAAVAMGLAAIGIYGVMAYSVGRRTREIGLRMALGASTRDVGWLVIGSGMRLTLLGVGAGLVGAVLFTRLMRSLLFGVSATDPLTYAAVAAGLALVALAACAIPAARAARVDPLRALRSP